MKSQLLLGFLLSVNYNYTISELLFLLILQWFHCFFAYCSFADHSRPMDGKDALPLVFRTACLFAF